MSRFSPDLKLIEKGRPPPMMSYLPHVLGGLLCLRVLFGAWASGLDERLGGTFGPERFAGRTIAAPFRAVGEFRRQRAEEREIQRRLDAMKPKVRRKPKPAPTPVDPGYYWGSRGPHCSRCGKQVRLRRGYCRYCGQRFNIFAGDPVLGCLLVIITIIGFILAIARGK